MRILLGLIIFTLVNCTTLERKSPDFKRVAKESKLTQSVRPSGKAEAAYLKMADYANKCFQLGNSWERIDATGGTEIISEERTLTKVYSKKPFHGEVTIRWYTKPNEPIDEGNILFLADASETPDGKTKVNLYGNKVTDNQRYFDNFSAAAAGKSPAYCPGK